MFIRGPVDTRGLFFFEYFTVFQVSWIFFLNVYPFIIRTDKHAKKQNKKVAYVTGYLIHGYTYKKKGKKKIAYVTISFWNQNLIFSTDDI